MRAIKNSIHSDGSGSVTLLPEEPEDMWHAFNLVRPYDLLTASTIRRVVTESLTGSTASHRSHMTLTIKVESLQFDPQAGELRVAGKIKKGNLHVREGSYHSLSLEVNRNFTLEKTIDDPTNPDGYEGWDSVARAQLREALDPNKGAEAVAVVMQDGLANICFITPTQTILKQRVEVEVPKKRAGAGRSKEHDKGLSKFYGTVLDTLLRQLVTLMESRDDSTTFPILLASPGFTASGFLKYITETAAEKGPKLLQELVKKKSFVVVHSSSGHLHSLNEVLSSPEVKFQLKDTKYAKETALMDKFFELLRKDDGRAWYGHKEVEEVVEKGAVGRGGGTLFISNDLFRSQDIGVRRRWVNLVDRVRQVEGGDVRVLSGDHESGKRLEGLGGVAAILTFPIEELDDEGDEDSASVSEHEEG